MTHSPSLRPRQASITDRERRRAQRAVEFSAVDLKCVDDVSRKAGWAAVVLGLTRSLHPWLQAKDHRSSWVQLDTLVSAHFIELLLQLRVFLSDIEYFLAQLMVLSRKLIELTEEGAHFAR